MGEVVNLRMVRKQRSRDEKIRQAEENRARHGRSKAEKSRDNDAAKRLAAHVDGHRRDDNDSSGR